MGWVNDKIDLLGSLIERFADAEIREKVMVGSEQFDDGEDPLILSEWTAGAMKRLNSLVDEDTAKNIMVHNACRFIEETFLGDTVGAIAKMKAAFEENGDIDQILQMMRDDTSSASGSSIFPLFTREGNVIMLTKNPRDKAGFDKAENDYEKQKCYCFCPLINTAKERVAENYCNCSAGFNAFIWEDIVGGPIDVKVIESFMKGDCQCTFATYLPEHVFK